MNNMEPLTAALPAGEWVTLPAHGTKLYPVTLAGVLLVEFMSSDSLRTGSAEMEVGDGGGPGGFFNRVRVKSATAQTVRLIVTSGDFAVSRIAGQVAVAGVVETAPDFSRVVAGFAYAGQKTIASKVGEYGIIQLLNETTKNMVVSFTEASSAVSTDVYLTLGIADLSGSLTDLALANVGCKLSGESSLANALQCGTMASPPSGAVLSKADLPGTVQRTYQQPLIIKPEGVLTAKATTANTAYAFGVEFFLEDV